MNLTKEELLAGAQSCLMQLASQSRAEADEGHWGVSLPDEHGGWRYFYDGKECGTMDEDRVVQRAYVLRQLAR